MADEEQLPCEKMSRGAVSDKARLEMLAAALDRGLADVENGRVKPIREVADRLIAKYNAMGE